MPKAMHAKRSSDSPGEPPCQACRARWPVHRACHAALACMTACAPGVPYCRPCTLAAGRACCPGSRAFWPARQAYSSGTPCCKPCMLAWQLGVLACTSGLLVGHPVLQAVRAGLAAGRSGLHAGLARRAPRACWPASRAFWPAPRTCSSGTPCCKPCVLAWALGMLCYKPGHTGRAIGRSGLHAGLQATGGQGAGACVGASKAVLALES